MWHRLPIRFRIGDAASPLLSCSSSIRRCRPSASPIPIPTIWQTGFLEPGINFPLGLFAPDYKTPRSTQINVGIQRELSPGVVLSVDYVRNVTTALLLGVDQNHTGDVQVLQQEQRLDRHISHDRPIRLRRRNQRCCH